MDVAEVCSAVLARASDGVVSRSDLLSGGLTDYDVEAALRRKVLWRLRRGVYCVNDAWLQADDGGRHLLLARATLRRLGRDALLTGRSALLAYGIPLDEQFAAEVTVARLTGSGRTEAGVVHRDGEVPPEHRTVVDGMSTVSVAWAAAEYARVATPERAVVAMDGVQRVRGVRRCHLEEVLDRTRGWSGARRARWAFEQSDGRAESVGESRLRVLLDALGFAPDGLQVEVHTASGRSRVDFYWDEPNVVGEFDGRVKYGRTSGDRPPADVAWQERQRELAIERAGPLVVRFIWSDLAAPQRVRARMDEVFARAARLPGRRRPQAASG